MKKIQNDWTTYSEIELKAEIKTGNTLQIAAFILLVVIICVRVFVI